MVEKDEILEMKRVLYSLFAEFQISISTVCAQFDVTSRQLRYWEGKGLIQPVASESKRNTERRYTLKMVQRIYWITKYLNEGYTLSKANELAQTQDKRWNFMISFYRNSGVRLLDIDKSGKNGVITVGDLPESNQTVLCDVVTKDDKTDYNFRLAKKD